MDIVGVEILKDTQLLYMYYIQLHTHHTHTHTHTHIYIYECIKYLLPLRLLSLSTFPGSQCILQIFLIILHSDICIHFYQVLMKKWGHLSSFHVFFLSYGLLKQIYIYASEGSHGTLSENDMVYKSLSHRSQVISD